MKGYVIAFVALCLCSICASHSYAADRVEFILDVSGSMKAMVGTEKKIDAARNALTAAIAETPEGSIAALRLYGHRVPNDRKAESCKDSELVIPFGPINKQQFLAVLNLAQPLGQTPIAYSLQLAGQDFGAVGDENATIILVSDGEETCGGDAVAVAKELMAKGLKLKVNTIGFNVDAKARAQLMALAAATGGVYRDASDAAGLAASLKEMSKQSFLVEKKKAEYGEPIKGGDSYETAVPLESGKLYSLSHHQRKNEYDYFYADLTPGQELKGTLQTGDQGVEISGDKISASQYPYAGMEIHNSAHQKVAGEVIIGNRSATKTMSFIAGAGQGGRYYVLLGNTYDAQSKDSPFKIEVIEHFDAGTKQDAPESDKDALRITAGDYAGFLGPGDMVDAYRFSTTPGGVYEIKARPSNDKVKIKLTVTDSDGVVIGSQTAPNEGAAVRIDSLAVTKGGDIFVKIESVYSSIPPTDYTFSIKPAGEAAAAQPAAGEQPAQPSEPAAQPVQEGAAVPPPAPAEAAAQAIAAAEVPAPAVPIAAAAVTNIAQVAGIINMLPTSEGAKFYLMYSVAPFGAGLLIGLIWGFLKGRKRRAS